MNKDKLFLLLSCLSQVLCHSLQKWWERSGWDFFKKELAHTVLKTGKPKVCRVGDQPGDPGKKIQRKLLIELCLSWRCSYFFPSKIFNWLAEPIHIIKVNLIYSKSTYLNVNFIFKNNFLKTSTIMFIWVSGYYGLPKLTYKINHHRLPIIPYQFSNSNSVFRHWGTF